MPGVHKNNRIGTDFKNKSDWISLNMADIFKTADLTNSQASSGLQNPRLGEKDVVKSSWVAYPSPPPSEKCIIKLLCKKLYLLRVTLIKLVAH